MKPLRIKLSPRRSRVNFTVAALALSGVLLLAPAARAESYEAEIKSLKVGLLMGAFPNVDQREAQAAMHLWTRQMARGLGIKAEPRTIVFKRTEDLLAAVNNGELTVVSIPALEYLKIRRTAHMSPLLMPVGVNGNKGTYVVVTRRDSGIGTIRELRGRSLLMATQKTRSVISLWLSVLLLREGSREPSRFFRETSNSISPSKALMDVFFKRSDAVVLSRGAFETSVALNPQLGRELAVLAESGNLAGVITCVPDNVSRNFRRYVESVTMHLHESGIGRQMCTLFQMERVIPFQPSHLAGLEELLRERDRLLSAHAGKR